VMLGIFHAGAHEFRSGWFVESLATQTLVIFAIRTRRVPFFRSHPSLPITLAALGVATVGAILPATPLAMTLGFAPLPGAFFAALLTMILGYLVLIEIAKTWFFRSDRSRVPPATAPLAPPAQTSHRLWQRRARRFTTTADLDPAGDVEGRANR
jgi:Mg2+-importing ATPase